MDVPVRRAGAVGHAANVGVERDRTERLIVRERVRHGRGHRAQRSSGTRGAGADRAEAVGRPAGGGRRRFRCGPRVPAVGPVVVGVRRACAVAAGAAALGVRVAACPRRRPGVAALGHGGLVVAARPAAQRQGGGARRRAVGVGARRVPPLLGPARRLVGLLGTSQWQVRPILAVAALGGLWALSFLLVCTGTALAVVVRPGTGPGARLGAAAVVVLLIGGAAGYGLTRSEPDVVGALRIGGVQPGVVDDRRERLAI